MYETMLDKRLVEFGFLSEESYDTLLMQDPRCVPDWMPGWMIFDSITEYLVACRFARMNPDLDLLSGWFQKRVIAADAVEICHGAPVGLHVVFDDGSITQLATEGLDDSLPQGCYGQGLALDVLRIMEEGM